MRRCWFLPLLISILAQSACWRGPSTETRFQLLRTSPAAGSAGLLLNDSITAFFSAPIHGLSVTNDTFTVVDDAGGKVPGALRVGATWVTFEPRAPQRPDLTDGAFLPGRSYHLVIAGLPRPDAVRASDGRSLDRGWNLEFHTVSPSSPAFQQLRPLDPGLPFLLRPYETLQSLPADDPRLLLHFTLPVHPASVRIESVRVQRLGDQVERLIPRAVKVVTAARDEYPGSTVEIDLGGQVIASGGGVLRPLREGDCISVGVQDISEPLRDYGGNPAIAIADQCWTVVAGAQVPLFSWPSEDGGDCGTVGGDPLAPGFETVSGVLRPRARIEAGDGSLGVFRPTRNTVLRPGERFDRGDGVMVSSHGSSFPFLTVDIPEGVEVRIEPHGGEPVSLLCCGSMRLAGSLVFAGSSAPLPTFRPGTAVSELLDAAPIGILAAGDVVLGGRVSTESDVPPGRTTGTIAAAGRIHLHTKLPVNTVLAVEAIETMQPGPAIVGPRGQVLATVATFTQGAPPGARWVARGCSPWRPSPADSRVATVQVVGAEEGFRVAWQAAPADPLRHGEPDLGLGRIGRAEPIQDQSRIALTPGSFGRFVVEVEVVGGRPAPTCQRLRLLDR